MAVRFASLGAVALLLLLALAAAATPWVMPSENGAAQRIAAGGIFVASYLALAVGKVPGLSIDRAGVALLSVKSTSPAFIAASTSAIR